MQSSIQCKLNFWIFYAALLPRRGCILRCTLSVRLSVCLSIRPVIVFVYFFTVEPVLRANIQNRKTSVFAYGPASRMYFSAHKEGRISYGHLGRTNSCLLNFACCCVEMSFQQYQHYNYPVSQ